MMKRMLVIVILCSIGFLEAHSAVYYVDTNSAFADDGWSKNDNSPSAPWETIQHGVDEAGPNDTLYVKYGTYIVVPASDTGLTIIGHKTTDVNDLNAGEGMPEDYDDIDNHQNDMPMIIGSREIGQTLYDTAISIYADDVTIKNFHLKNWKNGLLVYGAEDCIVENIFGEEFGDDETFNHGKGILFHFGARYNTVENCMILNAGQESFSVFESNTQTFENCKAYSDGINTGNLEVETDYFFVVTYSSHCVFRDCFAANKWAINSDPDHGGHGFVVQSRSDLVRDESRLNEFYDCDCENVGEPIVLRGGETYHNTFEDFKSTVTSQDDKIQGCVTITNGPYDNDFRRLQMLGSKASVAFFYGVGSNADKLAEESSKDNWFESCVFESDDVAIRLSAFSDIINEDANPDPNYTPNEVYNSLFLNCTFVGLNGSAFFKAHREHPKHPTENTENKFVNCIITAFGAYNKREGGLSASISLLEPEFIFEYCGVYNSAGVGWPTLATLITSGTGNLDDAVAFKANTLYELATNSIYEDYGISSHAFEGPYDVDGNTREVADVDVGAQETQ